MPSQLSQAMFDLLQVSNGNWLPQVTVNLSNLGGTSGNDDMIIPTGLGGGVAVIVGGGQGNDRIDASAATLNAVSTINGGAGDDQIFGSTGNNIINGGAGDDFIEGGGGLADVLNGGPGIDTLSYEHSRGAVTVDMSTLTALGGITVSGGDAVGDQVANNFENAVGSAGADTITGNAGNNVLVGLAGDDTLLGGDGNDIIIGGEGKDTVEGGAGNDTYKFMDFSDIDLLSDQVKFTPGDKLDFSAIDTRSGTPGDQPFVLTNDPEPKNGQIAIGDSGGGITVISIRLENQTRHITVFHESDFIRQDDLIL